MKNLREITLLLMLIIAVLVACTPNEPIPETMLAQKDYLLYKTTEGFGPGKLMFYDPVTNVHTPILPDWNITNFSISVNDQLAFAHEGDNDIYLLDFPFTDNVPVNIIHDASINYPISWSPDGYYLAYGSVHDDGKTLLIWNREISSPIHHYQEQISSLAWSSDGRLAFTEFYKFSSLDEGEDWNEVFIWEGDTAVNLSQNPSGEDRFPAWSADGRLAFLSERDSKHDIFVWDGTSKIDGVPDVNTFVKIAPNLTGYYSSPAWTNSDSLTFTGSGDSYLQIYEWDGRRATNISKNPGFHSGSPRWRSDGYWSFSNGIMSSQSLLHIRNEKNKTQLTVEKGVSSAWGQSGHLMICIRSSPTWTLSMWNGVEIIEITEGYNIDASWRNGEDVFCTSG